ncbi:CC0125/CC1285 family lipoprotein [Leptospira bandrabouensis]|uniref:CC0125/CC1285 family lipoprotein n=1 Tax=Leptospira bandrabouensis TaxID=2484903 RepID=UPI001EEB0672|nr:hypothetical protein [Leptospira bandrabouensis]MCG6154043.1 hypothetical protein [Leptospira bandrabouensis]
MKKLLTSIILLGCSCATLYQPESFSGGYYETQIDEATFNIKFNGNGYTSYDKVEIYLLYRAAEITNKHGFNYFIIVSSNIDFNTQYFKENDSFSVTKNYDGSYSGTINQGRVHSIRKPYGNILIKGFLEEPKENKNFFNAHSLLDYLAKEINI